MKCVTVSLPCHDEQHSQKFVNSVQTVSLKVGFYVLVILVKICVLILFCHDHFTLIKYGC